jgi:hypothetical protein
MLGNDISNDVPRRVLVHISAVFTSEVHLEKTLRFLVRAETEFFPDLREINALVRLWDRGVVIDAFHYQSDGYPAQQMYELLDGVTHPLHRLLTFRDYAHLSEFVAYSADIVAVQDPLHPMGFSRDLSAIF